ncbi:MAG TPA: NAD-dependent epimerase/dehydratase family protein [Acidimicrobiales bacterium]
MRVLVTGATGFVGSHATEAMVDAGHDVRLAVRSVERAEQVLAARGMSADDVDLVIADMVDPESLARALEGREACVHAAAAIGVTSAEPDRVITGNVDGARNVIGQAVQMGCDPVVHLSTVGVFIPSPDPVITPDSPLASPRNPYGRSKIAAEEYVRSLQAEGAPVTIIYPGGVYGPDQPSLDAGMEGIVGALDKAFPMPPSGGVGVLDVRDLAQVITRSLEPGRGPRRFMAGGRFHPWASFAEICEEVTGVRPRRLNVRPRMMLALGSAIDLAKRVRPFEYPLTRDAAEFMVKAVPSEDGPTLDELGVTYRPTRQTIADAIGWLASEGHLSPRAAGRLAPT